MSGEGNRRVPSSTKSVGPVTPGMGETGLSIKMLLQSCMHYYITILNVRQKELIFITF